MSRHEMRPWILALALAPALAACGTTQHYGQISHELFDLMDRVDPDGKIELSVDVGGVITEMEADVPVSALPGVVSRAALDRLPDGRIVGAEAEYTEEGFFWEVKLEVDGSLVELLIDKEGKIVATETLVDPEDMPEPVRRAAEGAVSGGTIDEVALVEGLEDVEYHVKKTVEGRHFKLIVSPEGILMRKMREQRAELEM